MPKTATFCYSNTSTLFHNQLTQQNLAVHSYIMSVEQLMQPILKLLALTLLWTKTWRKLWLLLWLYDTMHSTWKAVSSYQLPLPTNQTTCCHKVGKQKNTKWIFTVMKTSNIIKKLKVLSIVWFNFQLLGKVVISIKRTDELRDMLL
jgi:hypothetical protein